MSEAKFTKGEWKLWGERIGVVDNPDTQSYGMMREVAFVDMYNFISDECRANAHLIAASPEMYSILNDAMVKLSCGDYESKLIAEDIKSLLAKARGEL